MAYPTTLDPTTPTDASWAYQGDDEIRKTKQAFIERLLTVFVDLDADPLEFKPGVVPEKFSSGTLAQRPNPPEEAQLVYFAVDTDQWFVSKETDPDEFEWQESKAQEELEQVTLAMSAGEPRFAPNEDESSATRIKNAIVAAKLSSAPVKVVFVPKSMWGYVADTDYDESMYEPTVLLVREGSMVGWYDPIAYGADPTGNVNSSRPVDVCFAHAESSALGGSNSPVGMKVVAFTIPGTYTLGTDVDQREMGVFIAPGVELSGAGELTGTRAWLFPDSTALTVVEEADLPAEGTKAGEAYFTSDSEEIQIWNADADRYAVFRTRSFKAFQYTAGGAPAAAVVVSRELVVQIRGTATGTELAVSWAATGLNVDYPLNKLLTINAQQIERTGVTGSDKGDFGVIVDAGAGTITFTALASGTTTEFDVYMVFQV